MSPAGAVLKEGSFKKHSWGIRLYMRWTSPSWHESCFPECDSVALGQMGEHEPRNTTELDQDINVEVFPEAPSLAWKACMWLPQDQAGPPPWVTGTHFPVSGLQKELGHRTQATS